MGLGIVGVAPCCPYTLSSSLHLLEQPKLFRRRLCIARVAEDEFAAIAEPASDVSESEDVDMAMATTSEAGASLSQMPLISHSNINSILKKSGPIVAVDHYSRLGVPRFASNSDIAQSFKERVENVIQNESSNEESARKRLRPLQESFDVLMSEDQRRLYDWSIVQAESSRYVWPFEADITQKYSGGDPPPRDEDDEEGTRNTGYFFLAWFILSCILSVVLRP